MLPWVLRTGATGETPHSFQPPALDLKFFQRLFLVSALDPVHKFCLTGQETRRPPSLAHGQVRGSQRLRNGGSELEVEESLWREPSGSVQMNQLGRSLKSRLNSHFPNSPPIPRSLFYRLFTGVQFPMQLKGSGTITKQGWQQAR